MVLPRIKFLNLMVVLAAPLACFIIEKDMTRYGSPSSSSTVRPFLMSEVSIAAIDREVLEGTMDCRVVVVVIVMVVKVLGTKAGGVKADVVVPANAAMPAKKRKRAGERIIAVLFLGRKIPNKRSAKIDKSIRGLGFPLMQYRGDLVELIPKENPE